MRVFRRVALVACLFAAAAGRAAADERADAVLKSVRVALGGDARLSEVKAIVATGRTRQLRGDNLVPVEFEISFELPDKLVRHDEFPSQDLGPTSSGFNGEALIQIPAPPAGPSGPPGQVDRRVDTLKQDFARLMLGFFAGSPGFLPLTFTYAGTAEAPEGQADVIDAKGPGNFSARLFVSKDTHLPIFVSWQAPPAGMRGPPPGRATPPPAQGAPPPAAVPPGATAQGSSPPAAVENRLYFADYRAVDALKWPFRLRRAIGRDTVEETTFDRFRVNVRIDPKKFEVKR